MANDRTRYRIVVSDPRIPHSGREVYMTKRFKLWACLENRQSQVQSQRTCEIPALKQSPCMR